MSFVIKQAILEKIKEYRHIILFRHMRGDGDCVGAAKGLKELLQVSYPKKEIYITDREVPEYLAFLGQDDQPVADEVYKNALGIVLDTADEAGISDQKYVLCKELIKIDHHIPRESYGDLAWVEEGRSSCCEMVVEFYETFRNELVLNARAATCLYIGMVTDSGRFRFNSVNGDTLRRAATLLDVGVDTDRLFAQLYLDSYGYLKFKAAVYERMEITVNGVAYIFVDREMQEQFGLTAESAGACIECLESIRGCIAWIVFIETADEKGSIRARMRSRFVTINIVAERYGGGGHSHACGVTVHDWDGARALLADTDAWVGEYKATHEGWL